MAATLHLDILENARIREERGTVIEATRMAIVEDLSQSVAGGPLGSTQKIWHQALNVTGMPQAGDEHPTYKNLIVEKRVASAISTKIVQVEIKYTPRSGLDIPEPPPGFTSIVEGSATLDQVTSIKDINGDTVKLEYPGEPDQDAEWVIKQPRMSLTYTINDATDIPGTLARQFIGKVNLTQWPGGAGDERKWLCTAIPFTLFDRTTDPPTWRFSYTFEFDPEGHDPYVWFIDDETGRPKPDVLDPANPNAYAQVEAYQAIDFTIRGL